MNNNCGQQPVMVPTWVELDTRDLDVRDVTATNGSFQNLTVKGEPVLPVVRPILLAKVTQLTILGLTDTSITPALTLEAGTWLLSATVQLQASSNATLNTLNVSVVVDGVTKQQWTQHVPSGVGFLTTISGSLLIDYGGSVELRARQGAAGTNRVLASTSDRPSLLQAIRVS